MSKDFFVTYPVVVQEYGQVLNKEASLLLLRCVQAVGWSEPSMNPLPVISARQLREQSQLLTLRTSYKTSSLIQLAVFWEYIILRTFQYVITDDSFLIFEFSTLHTK